MSVKIVAVVAASALFVTSAFACPFLSIFSKKPAPSPDREAQYTAVQS